MIREQLPNLVSLSRILMAPVIFLDIYRGDHGPALIWLIFAAATDFLDGGLARYLKVVSRTGAYLDPLADKFLLSGTYFLLGYRGETPLWLTAIVFGRDALMLVFIAGAMLLSTVRDFPPTIWGKLSTLVQICAAFVVLLEGSVDLGALASPLKWTLMIAAAAATLWSAVDYLRIGIGMVRRSSN